MFSLQLASEQIEIRDTVRDFVNQVVKPVALKASRLEMNHRPLLLDELDQASQMGLRTLTLSEERGGSGADALTAVLVAEELAVGDVDLAAVLARTAALAPVLFDQLMSDAQRDRFLSAFLADDRYHLAYAAREPEADEALGVNYHRPVAVGSPLRTTATRAETGDWIINGAKECVYNAPVAKLFAVDVRTDASNGISTILVPNDAPGLTVSPRPDAYVIGPCGDLVFKDCRVPAGNLLGEEGHSVLAEAVTGGRAVPLMQALNLGTGRAAYEAALDYTQLRVQGGRRIVEHQAIGTRIADMLTRIETTRALIWQAAYAADHPEAIADRSLPDLPLATMARVYAAENMYQVAKRAADCFGGSGVMKDMPLPKYIDDALKFVHAGDGVDDAKLQLAEAIIGYRRPGAPTARAAE
ncbi:MAG TPA: acyl-CoA dehydrogenase family protein [Xanthobacteraceae bacterium]|nr:acyl-CoA dehydrogenase family protein [Xanthobacteraceae bacterium]